MKPVSGSGPGIERIRDEDWSRACRAGTQRAGAVVVAKVPRRRQVPCATHGAARQELRSQRSDFANAGALPTQPTDELSYSTQYSTYSCGVPARRVRRTPYCVAAKGTSGVPTAAYQGICDRFCDAASPPCPQPQPPTPAWLLPSMFRGWEIRVIFGSGRPRVAQEPARGNTPALALVRVGLALVALHTAVRVSWARNGSMGLSSLLLAALPR